YVGYEEGGQLTEAVRRRPYCVLLLDEIEKAHHEVFDVLLQILDDGRLTDGQGRTVDFRNTVIIMTSNIRSEAALSDHFRPEFLNRIDEIVEFKPLSREQLAEIVDLQLARLRERLAERGLELELTAEAKELIAEAGWDPAYGARPLKRPLQRLIENPLALRRVDGATVIRGFVGASRSCSDASACSAFVTRAFHRRDNFRPSLSVGGSGGDQRLACTCNR